MGWLRKKQRVDRAVTMGRSWADAVLDAAIAEVADGRLGAARTVLRECRDEPEIRVFRVGELAEAMVGAGDEIAGLAASGDPDLLVLAGAVFVKEAWVIRGSGRASTVGRQKFDLFHSHLAQAMGPLRTAAELAPEDPLPWTEQEPVSRGLSFQRDDKDRIWAEIAARCPTLTTAAQRRLQALAPKWGGTEEAMIAFARETVAGAPDGHPVNALLADAMCEGAAHQKTSVAKYAEAHRAELVAASTKLLTATMSLPRTVWAHNAFAAVFCVLGEAAHATEHLRAMGDHLCDPWDFVGGERAYQNHAAKYL